MYLRGECGLHIVHGETSLLDYVDRPGKKKLQTFKKAFSFQSLAQSLPSLTTMVVTLLVTSSAEPAYLCIFALVTFLSGLWSLCLRPFFMVGAGAKGSPRNLSLHITNRLLGAASSAPKEVASAICRALQCLQQPLSASPEVPKESPKEAAPSKRSSLF